MVSELDRVKSTITLSLGTKNRLRKLKGSQSYENFINHLLRMRNQKTHDAGNLIEIQKSKRKKAVFSYKNYKILFSYNQYYRSDNFRFDIRITIVRKAGKKANFEKFILFASEQLDKRPIDAEYRIYFKLLELAIRREIEPLFKHNGRFEDYFSWEREFDTLNLSKKAFDEDVMEKLENYNQGVHFYD